MHAWVEDISGRFVDALVSIALHNSNILPPFGLLYIVFMDWTSQPSSLQSTICIYLNSADNWLCQSIGSKLSFHENLQLFTICSLLGCIILSYAIKPCTRIFYNKVDSCIALQLTSSYIGWNRTVPFKFPCWLILSTSATLFNPFSLIYNSCVLFLSLGGYGGFTNERWPTEAGLANYGRLLDTMVCSPRQGDYVPGWPSFPRIHGRYSRHRKKCECCLVGSIYYKLKGNETQCSGPQ